MNWKEFQSLVAGLLASDVQAPFDMDVSIELLRRAMWLTAERAETQTLQEEYVEGITTDVLRQHGRYDSLYIRKFALPTKDSDKIDIDDLLIFVVAHYYAASASSTLDFRGYHESQAKVLTELFNQKVKSYEERREQLKDVN